MKSPVTIAVTGSKGGVGKSVLAVNLAVHLGRWGRKVVLVDGDLGLASLDVLLGLLPERNVEHLLCGEASLAEILLDGPTGVRLLPAASGVPDLARLERGARARLLSALGEVSKGADVLLVDTGAGLGGPGLALQLAASRVVVVTTPEPTSLVDAYASLKVLWANDPQKPADLVVNAALDEADAARAHAQVARACRHFLGREPGFLGSVLHDSKVAESVRRQRAVAEIFPTSRASRATERLAMRIVAGSETGVAVLPFWERLAAAVPAPEGPQ